ncbi:MAG TPA: YiiX/YebB-like N1pC/P60 family cysteine hydrolase [Thermoanaerobaculia bacterium]
MRKAALVAVLLSVGAATEAVSETLAQRQSVDRQAVSVYRSGVARLVAYSHSRTDLFPVERLRSPRLLNEAERHTVRSTWKSLLDYYLALDSLGRFHADSYTRSGRREMAPSFHLARGAFLAQYRFALDFIARAENDPKLAILLNDPVQELGLPKGSYDDFKFRYLNVAAASQFGAYIAAARLLPPADPDLARVMAQDEARIWKAGKGKGEALTAANAVNVIQKLGGRLSFPVQAGVSSWMGDTKVRRQGQPLISPAQIAAIRPRLEPGDILLQRREWYMSNVGLPGFWSHAALYVGTPAERRARFVGPEVRRWVISQGEPSGDLERLLKSRYPKAYALALQPQEHGHVPRVLEAISEGVVFTTLEHSAAADSMVALRPRLSQLDKARALVRAFRYVGRPYDFNFDFQTDSALVCTELVYKAYEPAPGFPGLTWKPEEVVGRTAIPANSIARQFAQDGGRQLTMVLFLDGQEKRGTAVEAGVEEFRRSWKRPKWHVLVQGG